MLRIGDRVSRNELIKQIEDQKKQLSIYETKLKDVVRAYKGLNVERDALQAIIEALDFSPGGPYTSSESKDKEVISEDDRSLRCQNADSNPSTPDERVEKLKNSLIVLLNEKKHREAAFQADKKALIAENEKLKEKLQQSAEETETQITKIENHMKDLHAKLIRIEADRERELSDHGSILAEMQQRFAQEKSHGEKLQNQIAELYKKLHTADQLPIRLQEQLNQLQIDLNNAKEEVESWEKKAEKTSIIMMLESEIKNLKIGHEKEMEEIKSKQLYAFDKSKEVRLQKLEKRIEDLTSSLGESERAHTNDQQQIDELTKKCDVLIIGRDELAKSLNACKLTESGDVSTLKQKIVEFSKLLREKDEPVDFYELLDLRSPCSDVEYDHLKEEYERYKLKTHVILKSRQAQLEEGYSLGSKGAGECNLCESSAIELQHMTSIIASLHDKLFAIEIDHSKTKNHYEEKCVELQSTITDLQSTQVRAVNDLRRQMSSKAFEMDAEIQKQRIRTMEILAEKEKELQITKAILFSMQKQRTSSDPSDPRQDCDGSKSVQKSSRKQSRESPVAPSNSNRTEKNLCAIVSNKCSITELLSPIDAKNIFYEQQLALKEKEATDLRSSFYVAECDIRILQQSSITKDLRNFEIIEKLKEEIRKLEGKVCFLSGDANTEYLRNIFVQLLNSDSLVGRKCILKAIATVLKLSASEMRLIDKHA